MAFQIVWINEGNKKQTYHWSCCGTLWLQNMLTYHNQTTRRSFLCDVYLVNIFRFLQKSSSS